MDKEITVLTKEDIKYSLTSLGVKKGMLLFVQSSLRPLGWINGGAQTIIEALMECVGYEGTIIMPAFTKLISDPASLKVGTVPRESWEKIRNTALPFSKKLTIPQNMGEVAVQFMRNEAVLRSSHPTYSFLAWGKYAKLIVEKHALHFGLSKESPLGKIVELNGYVVMLGMNYDKCEMLHLAQYSAAKCPIKISTYPIEKNGSTNWIKMADLDLNTYGYRIVGEVMEERKIVSEMRVGDTYCRMFSAREAVNITTAYLNLENDYDS